MTRSSLHWARYAVRLAQSLMIVAFLASCGEGSTTAPSSLTDPSFLVVSGDQQVGSPGSELPNPLVVRAEDARGRPLRGQIVAFRVVSGGGSVFAGVAITNRDGLAQERWTLGESGAQRVEARAVDNTTGAPITFGVFTAIFDSEPPVVTRPEATPNPALRTDLVHITALASDVGTGGSSIVAADYQMDGGGFLSMTAVDGAFDEPSEEVAADMQAPATGVHQLCMRATDAHGNVSALACIELAVADLFISEYIEGSGSNKAIELYNGTGVPVDLSGYSLRVYANGALVATVTVPLVGTLADKDVYVITHSSADQAIRDQADLIFSGDLPFNGDDAVVLEGPFGVVDAFGQVGFHPPGNEWSGGGRDDTLRRKAAVCKGDTNPSDPFETAIEWDLFPQDTFDGLGSHTTVCG